MRKIHSTAVVDPGAEIGEDVEIGPYCVVGPHARIGAGCRLISHVVVDGHTTLGARCEAWPFSCIGTQTQDLKYKGGCPRAEIGEATVIREYVTISAATFDGDATRVGSRCLLMASTHVAHDCQLGDEVILANCGTLAGHVVLEDQVILGGLSGVHQFVRIGRLTIVGGCTKVTQDLPPFMMADGNPLEVRAINSIGLKRHGVTEEAQRLLKTAHRLLYRQELSVAQALERIETEVAQSPEVDHLIRFIRNSERGIAR
ncbi:MAG: acyl-ACP--UDP-N-acetylglucosamine O-acyltransferase [Kiritimatiellia bacterium]|nr:acyl-ACP--UDP-N-acetylglucosamine O-acyltransferase [Kiritimatiellia bacterium]